MKRLSKSRRAPVESVHKNSPDPQVCSSDLKAALKRPGFEQAKTQWQQGLGWLSNTIPKAYYSYFSYNYIYNNKSLKS